MNRLLLDLGNTSLKAAIQQDRQLEIVLQHGDIPALANAVKTSPQQIWLSSVASQARTQALLTLLQTHWDVPVQQVKVSDYQHHLPTRYAVDQLGVDRWLAMLACFYTDRQACLVVDCGTAITLDLVMPDGQHAGGYILPGLHMMQQSLLQNTAIPWPVADANANAMLAQNTAAAIGCGSGQAVAALVEKMLKQAPSGTKLFIGGGDADKIGAMLDIPYTKMQPMVLQGLAQLVALGSA